MGPLGFALGLEEALEGCKTTQRDLAWSTWYLDDGHCVGSLEAVSAYLEDLQPKLVAVCLSINPS